MKNLAGLVFVLIIHSPVWADWNRDFNNGTLQGLSIFDPFGHSFNVTAVNGGVRFASVGSGGTDESVIAYDPQTFTTTSARLLIRYSTNPNLGPPGTKMNAGLFVRANVPTLSGYVLVMNDSGFLQLRKVIGGQVCYPPTCPQSLLQDLPGFTPALDYWIRLEAFNEGTNVHVRGRAWMNGDIEPCQWQVEIVDTSNPFLSGVVTLVANEDENGYFIDVDNASATSQLTCVEVCDNGADDNGDGLIDCHDPQCGSAAACACHVPFADADGDGDVDMDDFGIFQRCYSGNGGPVSDAKCGCFDRDDVDESGHFERLFDGNGVIDELDLAAFKRCRSGPGIPADTHCGD